LTHIEHTAQLLYKAVTQASVTPDKLGVGDLIIVTGADNDTVGIIDDLQSVENNQIKVILHTASGLRTLKVSDKNYIHLIKRADMLNLRKHTDYERDLKDMSGEKGHAERPKYGPVIDSDKSALPTSKISLNLRRKKKDD